jgi:hypothetical protein
MAKRLSGLRLEAFRQIMPLPRAREPRSAEDKEAI